MELLQESVPAGQDRQTLPPLQDPVEEKYSGDVRWENDVEGQDLDGIITISMTRTEQGREAEKAGKE